jgi:hypothetical protein
MASTPARRGGNTSKQPALPPIRTINTTGTPGDNTDLSNSLQRSLSFRSTGGMSTGGGIDESGMSSLLERAATPEPGGGSVRGSNSGNTSPAAHHHPTSTRWGELTPVMRNTRTVFYVDTASSSCQSPGTAATIPITPLPQHHGRDSDGIGPGGIIDATEQLFHSSRQSLLFGEHLAIPSNLDDCYSDDDDDDDLDANADDADDEDDDHDDNNRPLRHIIQGPPSLLLTKSSSSNSNKPPLLAPGLPMGNDYGPLPPFQLQARKFFSFQQPAYDDDEDDLFRASEDDVAVGGVIDDDDAIDDNDSDSYTPYKPSGRPAAFGIEMDELENNGRLDDIFQKGNDDELGGPIPMDFRVPSLHRADVMHGSTTTLTDGESLPDDDGSLSSLGSNILLDKGGRAKRYQEYLQQQAQQQQEATLMMMQLDQPEKEGEDAAVVQNNDQAIELESRRRQRRRKRRQQAREFLASIEGDESCVAEAASSRLLLQRSSPLRRQVSCPAHH